VILIAPSLSLETQFSKVIQIQRNLRLSAGKCGHGGSQPRKTGL